jgi:hypothetical protein
MTYRFDDEEELALLRAENAELRDRLERVQRALEPQKSPLIYERAIRLLREKAEAES